MKNWSDDREIGNAGQAAGEAPSGVGLRIVEERIAADRFAEHACRKTPADSGNVSTEADPALRRRVGEANRARARAEYDEAGMIARYGALYRGLIAVR